MTRSRGKRRDWPGRGGCVGLMRAYFSNPENAGEFMTYEDAVTKFGFSNVAVAQKAVYSLKNEGLVLTKRVIFADPERPR